jgi:hypothetical protein
MNRNHVLGGVLVVIVLAAAVGAMVYTGAGPAPGGDSGEPIEDFPTEESADDGAETGSSTDVDPFTFTVDGIEDCGTTCRDVTATLTNQRNETATGITTYIRIYAGENNTDTDDVVWEGTVDVGTLDAGDSHTTTERVELSLRDARKIDRNDGRITVLTAVESDEATATFQDSKQVG